MKARSGLKKDIEDLYANAQLELSKDNVDLIYRITETAYSRKSHLSRLKSIESEINGRVLNESEKKYVSNLLQRLDDHVIKTLDKKNRIKNLLEVTARNYSLRETLQRQPITLESTIEVYSINNNDNLLDLSRPNQVTYVQSTNTNQPRTLSVKEDFSKLEKPRFRARIERLKKTLPKYAAVAVLALMGSMTGDSFTDPDISSINKNGSVVFASEHSIEIKSDIKIEPDNERTNRVIGEVLSALKGETWQIEKENSPHNPIYLGEDGTPFYVPIQENRFAHFTNLIPDSNIKIPSSELEVKADFDVKETPTIANVPVSIEDKFNEEYITPIDTIQPVREVFQSSQEKTQRLSPIVPQEKIEMENNRTVYDVSSFPEEQRKTIEHLVETGEIKAEIIGKRSEPTPQSESLCEELSKPLVDNAIGVVGNAFGAGYSLADGLTFGALPNLGKGYDEKKKATRPLEYTLNAGKSATRFVWKGVFGGATKIVKRVFSKEKR